MSYTDDVAAARAVLASANDALATAQARLAAAQATAAREAETVAQATDRADIAAAALQLLLDNPPPPPVTVRFGMASGDDTQFKARLAETGPVHARRKFVSSFSAAVSLVGEAKAEKAAGRYAVYSSKLVEPWAGIPKSPTFKAYLDRLVAAMLAAGGTRDEKFFAHEHEPAGNPGGTGPEFAAAQAFTLDYLASRVPNWRHGIILNGFPYSPGPMHQTDAQIAAGYCPDSLIAVLNRIDGVLGADCYHGGSFTKPLEGAGPKIAGMSAWATRKGVRNLGIGEYNGLTAASITAAQDAVKADPRFVFACIFNSDANNRADLGGSWVLTGDRLAAFKAVL